ncbi:MAG: hypothetical protein COB66_01795 [Coxiella sp. (in: Bacteria)]|nr:MAG: hypothetical protein COB66_01795 [Coxiella sp. (in: g-proteobacteria)]
MKKLPSIIIPVLALSSASIFAAAPAAPTQITFTQKSTSSYVTSTADPFALSATLHVTLPSTAPKGSSATAWADWASKTIDMSYTAAYGTPQPKTITVGISSATPKPPPSPTPPPGPTPGKPGQPVAPSTLLITPATDSAARKPTIGKEYGHIQYRMWYGINAQYLDVFQDGQKICLGLIPTTGTATIPTTCTHSYTFPNYSKGSTAQQVADLEFGPTTITKHKYHLVLTNETGQTLKDFDVNLAPKGATLSPISIKQDPASAGKTTADTDMSQAPNVIINAASTAFKFNLADASKVAGNSKIFTLAWSNPGLFTSAPTQTDATGSFTVTAKSTVPGRTSLRITDTNGNVRYVGFTIINPEFTTDPTKLTPAQRLNDTLPNYVAMGSMTEDNSDAINYWRHFDSSTPDKNRRVDIRYIYLNQWSNGNPDGWASREQNFVDNGLKLGQTPFFVEYNVNGGQDNQQHIYNNLQDPAFMSKYFSHLAQAAQIAHREAGNSPVGFIIEPDMLGYMLHDLKKPVTMPAAGLAAIYKLQAPLDPSTINVPYSQTQNIPPQTALVDQSKHNFPNTLQGFVQAVNYVLWKYSGSTAVVGWQMNLWASPDNVAPGIIHSSRALAVKDAKELAAQGQSLGIRPSATPQPWDNSFISIDKYGLDGAGFHAQDANSPVESYWFWNANLYDNYVAFASNLAYPNQSGVTNLPIVLWQLPVGHLNGNQTSSPYTGAPFLNLKDVSTLYEGSSAPYFLGEKFTVGTPSTAHTAASNEATTCHVGGQKMPFFACPDNESGVTTSGSNVTWNSHMQGAANAHVAAILFGAGVGSSTHAHPITASSPVLNKTSDPDTFANTPDGNWFMYQLQQYYKNPVNRIT